MAEINPKEIPKIEFQLHARCLLRKVEQYFEDPVHQKEYKAWLREYKRSKKQTAWQPLNLSYKTKIYQLINTCTLKTEYTWKNPLNV